MTIMFYDSLEVNYDNNVYDSLEVNYDNSVLWFSRGKLGQ